MAAVLGFSTQGRAEPPPAPATPESRSAAVVLAGTPDASPGLVRVPVVLAGEPGIDWRIRAVVDGSFVACATQCTVWVMPGEFELTVGPAEGRAKPRTLKLLGPTWLFASPPDRTARDWGLGLGVTGGALIGVAFGLIDLALITAFVECHDTCPSAPKWLLPTIGATIVTGALVSPIGWVLYAKNRKPKVIERPIEAPTSAIGEMPDRRVMVVVSPRSTASELGLSIRMTF
jgi:hypothetical protein